MTFLGHAETIISISARMLGFIKLISREFNDHYTDKVLFVSLVRPNLEYAAFVSDPLIRSATRKELSVSNIILLGSIFQRVTGTPMSQPVLNGLSQAQQSRNFSS
jgi:hypothetical protein